MKVWQAGGHLSEERGGKVGDWSWRQTRRRIGTLVGLALPYRARTVGAIVSLLGTYADVYAPLWALCVYMIALGTIVPFVLIIGSLQHLRATQTGMIGMLEPVLATIVAWWWLGETLGLSQVVGGIVVLVGVGLAQTAR